MDCKTSLLKRLLGPLAILYLAGCTVSQMESATKLTAYPKLYQKPIKSIVIVPIANDTTEAEAGSLFSATMIKPLIEAGYYVISLPYTDSLFFAEGIVDGKQLAATPWQTYREIFDADAVLFVNLRHWDTSYIVAYGKVEVAAYYRLISTDSGEVLWQQNDAIEEDTTGNTDWFLFDLLLTALKTHNTDYAPLARDMNERVFDTLPAGIYHPKYLKDQDTYPYIHRSQLSDDLVDVREETPKKRATKVIIK